MVRTVRKINTSRITEEHFHTSPSKFLDQIDNIISKELKKIEKHI